MLWNRFYERGRPFVLISLVNDLDCSFGDVWLADCWAEGEKEFVHGKQQDWDHDEIVGAVVNGYFPDCNVAWGQKELVGNCKAEGKPG